MTKGSVTTHTRSQAQSRSRILTGAPTGITLEPSEIFQVTRLVVLAFDSAGVRYFLGGSVASALYGEARSTRGIDFVAAMLPRHVEPFVTALGTGFYADAAAIHEAVRSRRSFGVVRAAPAG